MSKKFDPFNVERNLYGCCDYESTWARGIQGWGQTDAESYKRTEVSTFDYDRLLALYCEATGIPMPTMPATVADMEKDEADRER